MITTTTMKTIKMTETSMITTTLMLDNGDESMALIFIIKRKVPIASTGPIPTDEAAKKMLSMAMTILIAVINDNLHQFLSQRAKE